MRLVHGERTKDPENPSGLLHYVLYGNGSATRLGRRVTTKAARQGLA